MDTSLLVKGIQPHEVDAYREHICSYYDLLKKKQLDDEDNEDLLEKLKSNFYQGFLGYSCGVESCLVITQIYYEPSGKKTGHIKFVAGKNRINYNAILFQLEKWLKDCGCDKVRLTARVGWVRKLSLGGYRTKALELEKVI
jgi:hypothetical protein